VGATLRSAEETRAGRASGSRAEQQQQQQHSGANAKHARFPQHTPPMCGGVPVRRSPLKRRVQLEPPPAAATPPRATSSSAAPARAASHPPHASPHTPVLQPPPPIRSRLGPHARANYVSYAAAPDLSPATPDNAAAATAPRRPVPIAAVGAARRRQSARSAAPAAAAATLRRVTRTPCAAAIAPRPASSSGPQLAAKWQLLEELFAGVCTVFPVLRARSMQVCVLPSWALSLTPLPLLNCG